MGSHSQPSDFVYFNHAQHVQVGEIECQKCHGPVEEMEIMYQHSSLTMGWCINCHRETNIKVESNEYYAKIHEALSKKYGVEKLTVAQMGVLNVENVTTKMQVKMSMPLNKNIGKDRSTKFLDKNLDKLQ